MQTQGTSSLWGGSSGLGGLETSWGMGAPSYSSGANANLLGYGSNSSLSNNQGHMQSGASSTLVDSANSNRGGWGAPGTIPPSQSTNKLPTSSSGNMQGSLPVSGAQHNGPQSSQPSGSLTTSQSPGPNGGMSSQGNSAFGNNAGFQKISTGNASSGLAINPATSITNSSNGSSAQISDNLGNSGWGMPNTSQDSRLTGTMSWGNPSGAEWDQSSSSVSQSQGPNPQAAGQADQQRPSSWAQAAGKGLNLQASNQNTSNSMSQEEIQRQTALRRAIESHDGWGSRPINQNTKWSLEQSPKMQRKISTASVVPDQQQQQQKGTNNMWNNNNGTAIWEVKQDNMSPWGSNPNAARAPGQPPSNWPGGQQKPPDPTGGSSQWGVGAPGQAPGPDKSMGPWGAPPGNQSMNANWGGSTETGYFGGANAGASGGISTWGEADGTSGWGDSRNSGTKDGTSYWGDPQSKPPSQPPNWNPSGQPGQPAIGQNRKIGSGWGDPVGPPDPKIDDGTGLWQSGGQQPPQAGGWSGDPNNQAQWNPAIGKPMNPKIANQNPAQYGGVDDLNWNLPKEDIWSEENMGGWDDADMGTWNDTAAQSNSTWNSATGWNKEKRSNAIVKDGAMKFPGGGPQPPQRIRLLQQLMDMGFKKDEAQHALITNDMNIQSALAYLYNRRKKEGDFDMGRMPGLLPDDDISDSRSDNTFVPNMNHMQNTPFTNAQQKIPNQFPFNNGPSLNNPSSLNSNDPSINNMLQQKVIHKYQSQQQPPPPSMNSMNPPQGPMGRGQLPGVQQGANVPQNSMQYTILHQLRLAVQAGLIGPDLLTRELPTPVLVMIQQLLQHQQNLQHLISSQHMLQQPNVKVAPHIQRLQLEQVAQKINATKQQILLLTKKIQSAHLGMTGKTPSQQPQQQQQSDSADNTLPGDINLSNLSISTSQPQSRLNQWKRSKDSPESTVTTSEQTSVTSSTTTTTNSEDGSEQTTINKAVGSKPIQQSNSTPNLHRYDELGLTNLTGDTTWSSTSGGGSQNWPISSSESSSSGDTAVSAESLMSTATTTESSSSSVLDSLPTIPEFVPGKPWQGISKNVEDDPHITPGSIVRSFSVNTVKDDYLLSLTKSSPSGESSSSWPSKPGGPGTDKPWSSGSDGGITSTGFSDVWSGGVGKGALSRPPPGLPQQQQKSGWMGMNRQHSWAGSAPRSDGSQWGSSNMSTALILKNLTPQIDGSTLRTLCMQHGPLQYFYLNLSNGQALVKYRAPEEAIKAQKSLNTCLLGNTTIVAEFVSEAEAQRLEQQLSAMSGPSQWSQGGQSGIVTGGNMRHDSWGSSTPVPSSMAGTALWGSGGNKGSNSGGLWDENLIGKMLGETM